MVFKYGLEALIGFGSGVVISGGVFAFIAVIGIIPRLIQKTKTQKYTRFYEDMVIIGGLFGMSTILFHYYIPLPSFMVAFISLCAGVFYGCLAVALAEVLNVIPVFTRHTRINKGIHLFIAAIAIGKMIGSILFYTFSHMQQ